MKVRAALSSIVALFISTVVWGGEHEPHRYTVIQIPDSNATYPRDINNQQIVAGFLYRPPASPQSPEESDVLVGFVQHKRLVLSVAGLYNDQMIANGINDRGDITGMAIAASGLSTAYLLSRGVLNRVEFPGSYATNVHGLNNKGEFAGFYYTPTAVQGRAFVYRNGEYTTLDPLNGQQGMSRAFDINDKGDVVGDFQPDDGTLLPRRGFLFRRGSYTPIEVPGALSTGASSINNAGVIVGTYSEDGITTRGFIFWKGRFATVHIPGSSYTEVSAINNNGKIVGTFGTDEQVLGFRSHFREFWK